jgi:hypothetical protein
MMKRNSFSPFFLSGASINVGKNAGVAYSRLKKMLGEANVKEKFFSNQRYIKPKDRKLIMIKKNFKKKFDDDLTEKVEAAKEILQQ